MRRKTTLRGLSRLISVLLACSLLSGLWVQTALAAGGEPLLPDPPVQEQELPDAGGEQSDPGEEAEPPAEDGEQPGEPGEPPEFPEQPEEPAPEPEIPELPEEGTGSEALDTLLGGTYQPFPQVESKPDKNILVYALREAQRAARSGLLEQLASSAPAGLKARFEAAILTADGVYGDADATYGEIQDAYLELQEVLWRLSYVRADKAALQLAVNNAAAIDLSGYTAESAGAVRDALSAARALLARDDLNTGHQSRITAAVNALRDAVDGLVRDTGSGTTPGVTPGGNPGGSSIGSGNRPSRPSTGSKPSEPAEQPGTGDPAPSVPAVSYSDVSAGAWYAEGVAYVTEQGIMRGTGNGQFSPATTMSRAMIWTMLYRLAGEPAQRGAEGSGWYGAAQVWARVNGVSDGSNPNGGITREQFAVMLYRYLGTGETGGDLSAFRDSGKVSGWAVEAMKWAVETGLINGKGGGILDPQGTATRAEAAVIFMRFMQDFQN